MRTIKHTPRGANLEKIEELSHLGKPDWVPYTKVVGEGTAVEEAMAITLDFSGLCRQLCNSDTIESGMMEDEDLSKHDIFEVLDQAAERLDQAEQEWLEARQQAVNQEPLLSDSEAQQLQMILMTYCEDCDSDEETGREVDALWNKIREAKA